MFVFKQLQIHHEALSNSFISLILSEALSNSFISLIQVVGWLDLPHLYHGSFLSYSVADCTFQFTTISIFSLLISSIILDLIILEFIS
jgi:hypothetical protein